MRRSMLCLVGLLFTAGLDCNRAAPPAPEPEPEESAPVEPTKRPTTEEALGPAAAPLVIPADLARPVNQLGVDIYGRLRDRPGNLALSPASISTALAMTYGGARGETAAQMSTTLHFPEDGAALHASAERFVESVASPGSRPYTLSLANRLFGEKTVSFEDPFLALTRDRYGAELERVDFQGAAQATREHINGWVATKTNDRIRDLMPPPTVTSDTRLVLVNALYFHGPWEAPFEESATRPETFYLSSTESVQVPTMHRAGSYRYGEAEGVRILAIPYAGDELSMTIVLPTATGGLAAVEGSLDHERLATWLGAPSPAPLVQVSMPRFVIQPTESIELKEILSGLGMPLAFDRRQADFTGIANPPSPEDRLSISHVLHRAMVEVTEQGTEAAAATAVVMSRAGAAPSEPVEFTADHPFLFFIHHRESGAVLFMGRLADPR